MSWVVRDRAKTDVILDSAMVQGTYRVKPYALQPGYVPSFDRPAGIHTMVL